MLDMKMTLLCAELPLILLLVVLLAVWAVQLVLNRRAKEQTNEQPAADAAAQQQEAVQPEPVYESQPQEQQQYAEQPEVVEEAAYAEEETYAEQEPYAEEPVEQAEEEAYAEEPAEQAEEVVYAEEVTEEETYAEETVEEVPEQPEEYAEQTEPEAERQYAAGEQPEGQAAGASYNLTGNSVVFERGDHVKQTWTEKYEALDEDKRGMLDKVFDHVTGEEGVRRLDLTANVRVKYKTHELFKADIKRGVPVLNFMLANTTLMRYVKELGTKKIKITPVTVKLNDDDDLQLALRTADMALEQAKSEEEFKKERRKEQRRERAKAQNAEN